MFERILESFFDRSEANAAREQFGNIENAIGARRRDRDPIELGIILPEFECPIRPQNPLNHLHYLASRDEPSIGHVIGSKRRAAFPKIETRPNKVTPVRD